MTKVNDIPVTKPARTLSDLAAVVEPRLLARAVDACERQGLISEEALRRFVERESGRGKHGIGILRELLAARDPAAGPSASVFQADVRLLLARLPERGLYVVWREEHRILEEDGWEVARVDFNDDEDGVVVEAEGRRYHSSAEDWFRDLERRRNITALGKLVLHVMPRDLSTPARHEAFLGLVCRTILRRRAARGTQH